MLLVDDVDSREYLAGLLEAMSVIILGWMLHTLWILAIQKLQKPLSLCIWMILFTIGAMEE